MGEELNKNSYKDRAKVVSDKDEIKYEQDSILLSQGHKLGLENSVPGILDATMSDVYEINKGSGHFLANFNLINFLDTPYFRDPKAVKGVLLTLKSELGIVAATSGGHLATAKHLEEKGLMASVEKNYKLHEVHHDRLIREGALVLGVIEEIKRGDVYAELDEASLEYIDSIGDFIKDEGVAGGDGGKEFKNLLAKSGKSNNKEW